MKIPNGCELVSELDRRFLREVREKADLRDFVDRICAAPTPRSFWVAHSTNTIEDSLKVSQLREKLRIGLAMILLEEHIYRVPGLLRLCDLDDRLHRIREEIIFPTKDWGDGAALLKVGDLSVVKVSLLERASARKRTFAFLNEDWTVLKPSEFPSPSHPDEQVLFDRAKSTLAGLTGAVLCILNDHDLRKAIEFVENHETPVTINMLAEQFGKEPKSNTMSRLWERLRGAGVGNLARPGRPAKR
ncbi:hypothetical protein QKW60_01625 [Defluviimonas aestuarii]|uniref:hypothetical protein n=1 Tax=Albidovulum aestuarii TaxID=1130726 RepID=UPI00249B43CA|nr:hypothetical protein [Defluviimonas aestuarii]MDI3335093.1 hypothetical protein [Defluviimonas aestuarii]